MTQRKHRDSELFAAPVEFDREVTMNGGQTVVGQNIRRPGAGLPVLTGVPAPSTSTTGTSMTEAELLGGIHVKTPVAAQDFQVPTGAEISAAVGADLEVDDSFDFTLINLGGTGDIVTLTVDTGVTLVGSATVDDPGTDVNSSGTFRFHNTAADTWVAYRVA